MLRKFFQNTRKPEGFLGRLMIRTMNSGHTPLSNWGLSLIDPAQGARVLDVGCGGGANIARLLRRCPEGFVDGIDYSAESVAFSKKKNAAALGRRCDIRQGDVGALPYAEDSFDLVIAFETVYFWPDLEKAFREILRVLKLGGQFLLVCESDDTADSKWPKLINGMTIYAGENLQAQLERAGFAAVRLTRSKSGWVALVGEKSRKP
jgi:ubiquinone/menaquinone biosynthesis C-methylase UbiE